MVVSLHMLLVHYRDQPHKILAISVCHQQGLAEAVLFHLASGCAHYMACTAVYALLRHHTCVLNVGEELTSAIPTGIQSTTRPYSAACHLSCDLFVALHLNTMLSQVCVQEPDA